MSRLGRILDYEVVSPVNHKYVYIMAGATVGGFIFAMSQSWLTAIGWDTLTVFLCWVVFKIANPLVDFATSLFRLLFLN